MIRVEFGSSRSYLRYRYDPFPGGARVVWSDFSTQFLVYFAANRDWYDAWVPEDALENWRTWRQVT
jgi:hypothetical protein